MLCCKRCGASAIEQTRGLLKSKDKGYVEPSLGTDQDSTSNNPANLRDTRVVCSNPDCDEQTGWNKAEFFDYTRFKWDRDHGRLTA